MYRDLLREYFDKAASRYEKRSYYYHATIKKFYKNIIPEGLKVLEVGCATGDLLSEVKPAYGVGIDISRAMITLGRQKHPELLLEVADIESFKSKERFDYVILSNLLDYVDDMQNFFTALKPFLHPETKIIITTVNPLWHPLIKTLEKLRLKYRDDVRHYITNLDVVNILQLLDYDIIETGYRLFIPFYIPFISNLMNKLLSRMLLINYFCFLQYTVAKPMGRRQNFSCSVVIPCFNEMDNIAACIQEIPSMGTFTEIVVVDDGSVDGTKQVVERLMKTDKRIKLISYTPNQGKGYALRKGFEECKGDVVIILDADMSVPPKDLNRFFEPIQQGRAEFVNGTRMVYPMQDKAMNFLRFLGNKLFGIAFSLLIGQRSTDTLCGTKAFLKKYLPYFKLDRCKWGDFDLLLSASRLKLKMIEMPIHYKSRRLGTSKIKFFKDGIHFLKVLWWGFNECF